MRKRKIQNDISANEKRQISIEKAISIAVITVTAMLHENRLEEEEYEKNLHSRLKGIQRKYGYSFLKEILPVIIKRMKESPKININLTGGNKNLSLRYEYLEKYLKEM